MPSTSRPAIGTGMAHHDTLAHERNQTTERKDVVSKRGRKKRDRKKNGANHGKRPNT
ncbi:MAG: hypothetical protein ABIZ05_18135 [Pseudonocardiaceae bacterium]